MLFPVALFLQGPAIFLELYLCIGWEVGFSLVYSKTLAREEETYKAGCSLYISSEGLELWMETGNTVHIEAKQQV